MNIQTATIWSIHLPLSIVKSGSLSLPPSAMRISGNKVKITENNNPNNKPILYQSKEGSLFIMKKIVPIQEIMQIL